MKRIVSGIITVLYALQILMVVGGRLLRISFIELDTGIYFAVLTGLISVLFLGVIVKAEEKKQNIAVACMFPAFLISLQVQIILVLAVLGIRILGRYERTPLNKIMKFLSVLFVAMGVLSFLFIPAVVSNYQEVDDNIYRILESEKGDNILIISNYDTSAYGIYGYVELRFYKKRFGLFKDQIAEHQLNYQFRLSYEWLDNEHIKVYDYLFEFEDRDAILLGEFED